MVKILVISYSKSLCTTMGLVLAFKMQRCVDQFDEKEVFVFAVPLRLSELMSLMRRNKTKPKEGKREIDMR